MPFEQWPNRQSTIHKGVSWRSSSFLMIQASIASVSYSQRTTQWQGKAMVRPGSCSRYIFYFYENFISYDVSPILFRPHQSSNLSEFSSHRGRGCNGCMTLCGLKIGLTIPGRIPRNAREQDRGLLHSVSLPSSRTRRSFNVIQWTMTLNLMNHW